LGVFQGLDCRTGPEEVRKGFLMKNRWLVLLLLLLVAACGNSSSSAPVKSEFAAAPAPKIFVEREKVEKERPLPPEVKIKLRRDGKENYSWELNGTDVDQILKVNGKMAKELGERGK
jgi:hypothetical protein